MSAEPLLEVLDAGLLTTVQDAGRPGWGHLGVPESGAADPWSRSVANLLVRNDAAAAVLEATVIGPTLRAIRDVTIGLAGADLGGRAAGRRLPPGRSHRLACGDVLELPGDPDAPGCRAYLAVAGGFDVPVILGSRSTCLPGRFGGFEGRPLLAGDELRGSVSTEPATGPPARAGAWPIAGPDVPPAGIVAAPRVLRVVPGPWAGLDALVDAEWVVSPASDRVGTRLTGPTLPDGIGGEATTFGVPWGAIQVPPDGQPIVLGPDHQTTGGYRVVGVVISADRPVLGQLEPGAAVRLVAATDGEALAALRDQRQAVLDGAAALRDANRWDALVHAAGG